MSPGVDTSIMDSSPPHISGILLHKRAQACFVHHASIVPSNEVSLVLPFNADNVLRLSGVCEQSLNEFGTLWLRHTLKWLLLGGHKVARLGNPILQVVHVVRNVDVLAPAGPVCLYNIVAAKGEILGIDVLEPLAVFRCRLFSRVHQIVAADVFVLEQIFSQVVGQFVESGSGVREIGVSAMSPRRQLVGTEEAVSCSSRIEA